MVLCEDSASYWLRVLFSQTVKSLGCWWSQNIRERETNSTRRRKKTVDFTSVQCIITLCFCCNLAPFPIPCIIPCDGNVLYCLYCSKDIELLTDEITLPPDRPPCGFYNELCPQDNSGNFSHMSVLCTVTVLRWTVNFTQKQQLLLGRIAVLRR